MNVATFPEFRPHRLLPGGHAQTLAGVFLPWRRVRYQAVKHRVELPDSDTLILHDDRPESWQPNGQIALLLHGLAGCYLSPYMVRVSDKLRERGVRTFRLDLRGCGAGAGLARQPYHAGRSDDAAAVVAFIAELCPDACIGMVGFSLSGNIVLKYLGEPQHSLPPQLTRAIAVNPPIDLKRSISALDRTANRVYDRHFTKLLNRSLRDLQRAIPDVVFPPSYGRPQRLYDFDDQYTAPAAGFKNAEDYYARCSANQFLANITIPTLILSAHDDPLVPVTIFEDLSLPETVSLYIANHGGHLGYIAVPNRDPDRRWLDWRIVDWLTAG